MTPNVGGTWDENPAQMRQLQGFHSWKVGTGTTLVNAGVHRGGRNKGKALKRAPGRMERR